MRTVLLYRQGSDIPEDDPAQLARFCRDNGLTGIAPKAAEGQDWMARFDADPRLRIGGLGALSAQRALYAAAGLSYEPWVLPRGARPEAEAKMHARIGKACGTLLVDYEQGYPGYFDQGGPDAFNRYAARLRADAGGVRLVLLFDARQVARGEVDFGAVFWHFDAFGSQDYWTDFREPWGAALAREAGAYLIDRDRCPVLPGNAQPGDFLAALAAVRALWSPPTVYVFQRVGFRPANGAILRSLR